MFKSKVLDNTVFQPLQFFVFNVRPLIVHNNIFLSLRKYRESCKYNNFSFM